ncbi:isoprenylcysteine carboxylmethyltransferase family protein [Methanoregula sp.]|uniref:methyltransferase family protein n=1 Tax=Methanoregula sp. TaxID=2052170 RepID=UPI002BA5623B|nr:isoprenylcysteine carboxylmethyltransferase family protein [Methanoregula sp.]HVP96378.1 isoprenylcysteine carboxylmethyltransferase family protein [Methanoregula sp.]
MQVFDLLFALVWIVFYAYWLISAWQTRSPVKRTQSRLSFLMYGVIWVVIGLLFVSWISPELVAARLVPAGLIFTLAGLLITVAGLAFAVWARVHLGSNWSARPTIRTEHTLTRTGPYRYVRHPIYSGILLGLLGTAIGIGYFIIFACVLILLAGFVIKFRMEEKYLEEEFGEEYARYRQEVKALIPYVL